jgi:hypothetical protein
MRVRKNHFENNDTDRTSIIPDGFFNTDISQTGDECYSLIN